jgi:dephospho-CoA kinase
VLKVGLTGGIGCGKTTVSQLFAERGVPIIDADIIAHDLVKLGQPALQEIANFFGKSILLADGSLNRAELRNRVFSNPREKTMLENILHPLIFADMQNKIDKLKTPYCIASIPLLFETGMCDFVDRVLVIDCPEDLQITRVKQRDNLTEERIKTIIASQVSREFRLANADEVLDNSTNNRNELAQQVETLHNSYCSTGAS